MGEGSIIAFWIAVDRLCLVELRRLTIPKSFMNGIDFSCAWYEDILNQFDKVVSFGKGLYACINVYVASN